MSAHYVIAAGGTGGHMVPASVLAGELRDRGHRVTLMTDARGLRFPGLFEGVANRIVESASISGRNPINWLRAILTLRRGMHTARKFLSADKVSAVIGFGGYAAVPTLIEATSLGIPAVIHEQNAVLGRTNRLLAGRAARIATSFSPTLRLDPAYTAKTVFTGLPVRAEVVTVGTVPYPATGERIGIFVFGGSQGASILSQVVPAAIGQLPPDLRARLDIVQQTREADVDAVRAAYAAQGTAAMVDPYFTDVAAQFAAAHLVIGRSGASTMAELTAAGRPAILVPFAAATDDHQAANAAAFVDAGAGPMMREADFTPDALAAAMTDLLTTPGALAKAATAAKRLGHPRAGATLADLVTSLAA